MLRSCIVAAIVAGALIEGASAAPTGETSPLEPLVKVLRRTEDPAIQRDVLRGMHEALNDRRSVPMPEGWHAVYDRLRASNDAQIRQEVTLLSLLFGDAQAVRVVHEIATDRAADPAQRSAALETLVQSRQPDLAPVLARLLDEPPMSGAALRAMAAYADERTPYIILGHYAKLPEADKRDAIMTLSARPAWAAALLDAIEQGTVPKQDLTAFNVRQIANLNDPQVNAKLKQVWGPIRGTSQDKLKLLAEYKSKFTPEALAKANLSHGRVIFSNACGVCHMLFDSGGQVGPNLTGAQRFNLDYVLGKVLDPSAVVARDYHMTVIKLKDGRVINGIVQRETDAAVTLKAPNETIVVQKDEIDKRKLSDISMMPEGLLASMSTEDARDLLAYLASPTQVAMQGTSSAR